TAMYVDADTDMEDLRDQTVSMFESLRANRPDETVEISILLNKPNGPPGTAADSESIELARAIQRADHHTRSFQIVPTEHLPTYIQNVPDHQNPLFSSQANQHL